MIIYKGVNIFEVLLQSSSLKLLENCVHGLGSNTLLTSLFLGFQFLVDLVTQLNFFFFFFKQWLTSQYEVMVVFF